MLKTLRAHMKSAAAVAGVLILTAASHAFSKPIEQVQAEARREVVASMATARIHRDAAVRTVVAAAPGDSVTGTFASSTATQVSATLFAKQNTSIAINMTAVTASSTSIILENRVSGGSAWTPIKSYSTATAVNDTIANDYGYDLFLRLRTASIPSADTVTYYLTRVIPSRVVQEWFNNNGVSVLRINDVGIVSPSVTARITGTADSATGAARAPAGTLTGTTLKSTVVSSSLTSVGTLGSLTTSGDVTLGNNLIFSSSTPNIIPGATKVTFRNNANNADNLSISDAGTATLRTNLVFASSTPQIVGGATNLSLRNNANTADNLLITDAGVATFRNNLNLSPASGSVNFTMTGASSNAATLQLAQTGISTWNLVNLATSGNLQVSASGYPTLTISNKNFTFGGSVIEPHYAPAYSASITPDASQGNSWTITATNGTAFTINAPTNPATGQRITLTIRNTSGGVQGAVTFNAVFKTAGYTVAANGFSASADFEYDGTNWVQKTAWVNTIPN